MVYKSIDMQVHNEGKQQIKKSLSLPFKSYCDFFLYIYIFFDLLEWKNLNELE